MKQEQSIKETEKHSLFSKNKIWVLKILSRNSRDSQFDPFGYSSSPQCSWELVLSSNEVTNIKANRKHQLPNMRSTTVHVGTLERERVQRERERRKICQKVNSGVLCFVEERKRRRWSNEMAGFDVQWLTRKGDLDCSSLYEAYVMSTWHC